MKKALLLICIITLSCSKLFPQKRSVFMAAGPALGFPVSNANFSFYYKTGIGGSLQTNFGITKLGSITTGIRFLSMKLKNPPRDNLSLTTIKAGYRTNFLNSHFFLSADGGVAFYGSANSAGKSHFILGGIAGYSFHLSGKSSLDLFPAYERIFGTPLNSNWLSINVQYRFKIK